MHNLLNSFRFQSSAFRETQNKFDYCNEDKNAFCITAKSFDRSSRSTSSSPRSGSLHNGFSYNPEITVEHFFL